MIHSNLLKSQRSLLRSITIDDIDLIFSGLSNPKVNAYYGVRYSSRDSTREQMKWFEDLETTDDGKWWAICSSDNQIFYGAGGLNEWRKEHRKAELGFWLLPQFWGKGIMNEAVRLILDFGFEKMQLHRIESFVETRNTNCIHFLQKAGFKLEGTMTDCEWKDGQFISLHIYSMVRR